MDSWEIKQDGMNKAENRFKQTAVEKAGDSSMYNQVQVCIYFWSVLGVTI